MIDTPPAHPTHTHVEHKKKKKKKIEREKRGNSVVWGCQLLRNRVLLTAKLENDTSKFEDWVWSLLSRRRTVGWWCTTMANLEISTLKLKAPLQLKAYKSLQAFNYFHSGYVHTVHFYEISPTSKYAILKAKVNPSQKSPDDCMKLG